MKTAYRVTCQNNVVELEAFQLTPEDFATTNLEKTFGSAMKLARDYARTYSQNRRQLADARASMDGWTKRELLDESDNWGRFVYRIDI